MNKDLTGSTHTIITPCVRGTKTILHQCERRLTGTTHNAGVFVVAAVVLAERLGSAVEQRLLAPRALGVVQQDGAAASAKVRP